MTGNTEFGYMPSIPQHGVEEGPIFLLNGRHFPDGRGFGLQHIWIKHKDEIRRKGYETLEDIPRYILDIINQGAKIYDEGGILKHPKYTILKSRLGICIVRFEGDHTRKIDPFYTVVTAYPKENPHGSLIGEMGV